MMVYFPWINDFVDTTCKKTKTNKGNRSILDTENLAGKRVQSNLMIIIPSANFLPNFEPKLADEAPSENNKSLNKIKSSAAVEW